TSHRRDVGVGLGKGQHPSARIHCVYVKASAGIAVASVGLEEKMPSAVQYHPVAVAVGKHVPGTGGKHNRAARHLCERACALVNAEAADAGNAERHAEGSGRLVEHVNKPAAVVGNDLNDVGLSNALVKRRTGNRGNRSVTVDPSRLNAATLESRSA